MLVWGWARTPTRIDPRRRVACLSFWILGMCFPSNLPTNTISTSFLPYLYRKKLQLAIDKILIIAFLFLDYFRWYAIEAEYLLIIKFQSKLNQL